MAAKKYRWSFNRFDVELPRACVIECAEPGKDAFAACVKWVKKLKLVIQEDLLEDELREVGAWFGDELRDYETNLQRILWIAACNIREELCQGRLYA